MNLLKIVNDAKKLVKIGGKYCHYKSNDKLYLVLHVGIREADEKPVVVYQALYGDQLVWVRDLDVWNEKVMINEKEVSRFVLME